MSQLNTILNSISIIILSIGVLAQHISHKIHTNLIKTLFKMHELNSLRIDNLQNFFYKVAEEYKKENK